VLSYVGIGEYAGQDSNTRISRWVASLTIWLLDTRTQIILCTTCWKSGGFLYPCGCGNTENSSFLWKSVFKFFSSNLIISPWKFIRPSLPLSNWFQYLISWFYKCGMHAVCTFLCVVVHMPNWKSFYWRTSNQNVIKITSSYIHDVRQVKCHGLCRIAPP
jgi:hypothetical protein